MVVGWPGRETTRQQQCGEGNPLCDLLGSRLDCATCYLGKEVHRRGEKESYLLHFAVVLNFTAYVYCFGGSSGTPSSWGRGARMMTRTNIHPSAEMRRKEADGGSDFPPCTLDTLFFL